MDSSCIEKRSRGFDSAEKIVVADSGYRYQIDGFVEQRREGIEKLEVRGSVVPGLHVLELNEKSKSLDAPSQSDLAADPNSSGRRTRNSAQRLSRAWRFLIISEFAVEAPCSNCIP